jgi:hypothetical protein
MNGMFSPHTPDFPDFMYLDFIGADTYPKSSCKLNQFSEDDRVTPQR